MRATLALNGLSNSLVFIELGKVVFAQWSLQVFGSFKSYVTPKKWMRKVAFMEKCYES